MCPICSLKSNTCNAIYKGMSTISSLELLKAFPDLLKHSDGPANSPISGPSSQVQPHARSIVYVGDTAFLAQALKSEASVVVVGEKNLQKALELNLLKKTLFCSPNTYLTMALVNTRFFSLPFLKKPYGAERLHPTAVIDPSAQLAADVIVGPYAVIGANTKVLAGTFIGAHVVIEANTNIGNDCVLHPHVFIGHTCQIGARVEVKPFSVIGSDGYGFAPDNKGQHHKIPHYGAVIIGDDVNIGANVNIDRGTYEPAEIGSGTKIDNHCHFGHNVKVGKNCLITAGFISAGSSTIGDRFMCAGRTSVNGHINITDNVTLGALTAATNDITTPGAYMGFPPIPFREALKVNSSLQHLPSLRKNVAKIMRHLGLSDNSNVES